MNIVFINVIGALAIGILTFCLGIYRITNGRMIAITEKLEDRVQREECHMAQKTTLNHFDKRFDDLKDYIGKNGKETKT